MESKTETAQETKETHEKHERDDHDGIDFGRMLLTLAGMTLMEKMGSGELHIIVIGESSKDDEDEPDKSNDAAENEDKDDENAA